MIRLSTMAGKSVAVLGLGQSGIMSARALLEGGALVSAWDDKEKARAQASLQNIPIVDLKSADWSQFASLVLAPGVPLTHPEPHWSVEKARAAGIEVIGDVELFCRQRAHEGVLAPFIGITGTNGKSTTTALVAHLLRTAGVDVQMGGNIGRPVLDLESFNADRFYIVEVSSYQIDLAPSCAPIVGVLLNITPDHLDRHGTLANYVRVKHRLIEASEKAVVSLDDDLSRAVIEKIDDVESVYTFTSGKGSGLAPRFYAIGATLFAHNPGATHSSREEVANLEGISSLRGSHNVQNALAATACLRALQDWFSHNAHDETAKVPHVWDLDRLRKGLATFSGLPHRLEEVGRLGSVTFINDSKATNAVAAEKALSAFDKNIFWIAGGRAKEGGIDVLGPLFGRVKRAYLIGEASGEFARTFAQHGVAHQNCDTLDVAVSMAARDAQAEGSGEAVVLLSPACASFDQFQNFEVRGDAFRTLVGDIEGVVTSSIDADHSKSSRGRVS